MTKTREMSQGKSNVAKSGTAWLRPTAAAVYQLQERLLAHPSGHSENNCEAVWGTEGQKPGLLNTGKWK